MSRRKIIAEKRNYQKIEVFCGLGGARGNDFASIFKLSGAEYKSHVAPTPSVRMSCPNIPCFAYLDFA